MAPIIQISKIQIRGGNKADLPNNLSANELGFSEDTGELFVGAETSKLSQVNRTIFPFRNVQVLTEFSKNAEDLINYYPQMRDFSTLDSFDKPSPRYTPKFGSSSIYSRKLQERLDERVSVLSYGAKANGTLNDITNNAISSGVAAAETFAINLASVEVAASLDASNTIDGFHPKALYFPAGVYVINNQLLLPPRSTWVGDGPGKTIIYLNDANVESVFTTTSSAISVNDLPFANNPGGGSGALATATLAAGAITGATITNAGLGYKTPVVTISGDGTGATATASVNATTGAITSITITNGGSGYTTATINVSGGYGSVSNHTYLNISSANGLPEDILVSGIEFRRTGNGDVGHIIRGSNVIFDKCKFKSGYVPGSETVGYTYNGSGTATTVVDSIGVVVDSLGGSIKPRNVMFKECHFDTITYSLLMTDDVRNIMALNCKFECNLRAVSLAEPLSSSNSKGRLTEGAVGPSGVKTIGCHYLNVAQEGFYVWDKGIITATASATQSSGVVNSINVTNTGAGYTTSPTVTITDSSGTPTALATATAAIDGFGKVSSITITSGGAGYTTPIVTISPPPGSPAFSDNLDNGYGHNVSMMNIYDKVGNNLDATCTPGATAITPVVRFGTGSYYNVSLSDLFSRNSSTGQPRVSSAVNGLNMVVNAQDPALFSNGIAVSGVYQSPLITSTMAPSVLQTTANGRILIPTSEANGATLDYTMVESTPGSGKRIGTMRVITDGTNISFDESFTDFNPGTAGILPITLFAVLVTISSVQYIEIQYTHTGANNVTFKYRASGWLDS